MTCCQGDSYSRWMPCRVQKVHEDGSEMLRRDDEGAAIQLYCKCKCPRYSDLEGWFHGARQHPRLWVSLSDVIMSCYSWAWSVQGMMSFHAGWLLWPRSEEDGSSNENETQTGATPGTVAHLSWAKGHQLSEVTVGQTAGWPGTHKSGNKLEAHRPLGYNANSGEDDYPILSNTIKNSPKPPPVLHCSARRKPTLVLRLLSLLRSLLWTTKPNQARKDQKQTDDVDDTSWYIRPVFWVQVRIR